MLTRFLVGKGISVDKDFAMRKIFLKETPPLIFYYKAVQMLRSQAGAGAGGFPNVNFNSPKIKLMRIKMRKNLNKSRNRNRQS